MLPVVYLAAGRGARLGDLTADRPKALIEVGGRPLVEHALDALAAAGFGPIVAVTGHAPDRLDRYALDPYAVVRRFNSRWHDQNNVVSLWCARDVVAAGCLIVNCDVLFDARVAARAAAATGTSLLVDDVAPVDAESMKAVFTAGRLTRLHKTAPAVAATGEYIGLARIDPRDGPRLAAILDEFVARGDTDVYYEAAIEALAAERPVTATPVGGLPWIEIDDRDDLAAARDQVWPAIERARAATAVTAEIAAVELAGE